MTLSASQPMSQSPLQGKVALVTGASRGLGLEIARQLAKAGAHLLLVARDAAMLKIATETVQRTELADGQRISWACADLADEAQLDATVHACEKDLGPVDVLVNNAAIQGPLGAFDSTDWEQWKDVFAVDFFAAARLSRLVIPAMRGKRWGKIINLSGGGATGPRPDVSAYACAKTALMRLSETLAEELKDAKIDVNAVAPGAMNTRMLEETLAAGPGGARREYEAAMKRAQAGGASPSTAAELVVWLASPASDGITGRLISAVWDDWRGLAARRDELAKSDVFTLRRIVPKDRGLDW